MSKQGTLWVLTLLCVLLSGVATTPEQVQAQAPEKLTPVSNPPNLMGTWKGEWGGNMVHPIEIVVDKQEVGTVSGKMSIPAIYRMDGVIGAKPDGSLWVTLTVFGPSAWEFQLKVISEKKLEGTGRSPRHYGPVVLDRE